MTLVLVAPAGGHAPLVAAAMAAAAARRGVRVDLGEINDEAVAVDGFADSVRRQLEQYDLVVVYFDEDATDLSTVQGVYQAVTRLEIDLTMNLAVGQDTDRAVTVVETLRDSLGVPLDGLVLDDAPTEDVACTAAKEFVQAVTGVPVIGALPLGCAAMEPDDFQAHSVTWFD